MTTASLRLSTLLVVTLALSLLPVGACALGTPEWAKAHLDMPTPSGGYIAKKDRWVIVYAETEFVLLPGDGIRKNCRVIFESLADTQQSFSYKFSYDEGATELRDIALNVDRGNHWESVNLKRNAVQASREAAGHVVLTSVDEVEPHKRVILEYVEIDRFSYLPWAYDLFVESYPIAVARYFLAPGSPAAFKMRVVLPEGDALPACLAKESETAWTIRAVPASSRIPAGYALQPDWTSLYPYLMVWMEPRGGDDRAFLQRYREGWESARKAQENEALLTKARTLAQGATSGVDKALRIAEFVQHSVLYDDSNVRSIHAWVPLKAEETLRSLKGDCKAKTLLAQSLLKSVGIESQPVLLRMNRDWFSWGPEPATAMLNHVILAVDLPGEEALPATLSEGPVAGWVLFDPVLQTASFGEPLPGYEGLPALLVGESSAPRFSIHTRVPSAERLSATVRYQLDPAGVIRGTLSLKDNGAAPLISGLARTFSQEDIQTLILGAFPASLNRVQLLRSRLVRAGENGARQMELELGFQLPGATQAMASSVLLENPFALPAYLDGIPNGYWPPTPPNPDEKIEVLSPWDNKKNAHGVEEVLDVDATVELPPGYLWSPSAPRDEKAAALVYRATWREESPGVWRGTLHLERHRGLWPTADRKARLKSEDALFTELYKSMELKKS